MWRPRSEAEIQAGIDNGIARESATFDAKLALPAPGRNKDLAKDICAMTVDGGVLLYGLGGDDPTRPNRREPFPLAGAAERVDQVAQTAIAEPPVIEIHDILSDERPGNGYLCVTVPPSPRAPHMLTIDGDNRYWGRGATGNRILSEGEVARLYERRERWELDRDELMALTVGSMPFTFQVTEVGVVTTVVRPVVPSRELLRVASGERSVHDFLQLELTSVARQNDPYPDQGSSGLGDAVSISRAGADVWVLQAPPDQGLSFEYQSRGELSADGTLVYWHSPVMQPDQQGGMLVMERSVTRAVYQALAAASWLHERAGFHGSVDAGVAVLGIEAAHGGSLRPRFRVPEYGAPNYRRHARLTSESLRSQRDQVVRQLLEPLFEVISIEGYDCLPDNPR